jgi:hypothetical protein
LKPLEVDGKKQNKQESHKHQQPQQQHNHKQQQKQEGKKQRQPKQDKPLRWQPPTHKSDKNSKPTQSKPEKPPIHGGQNTPSTMSTNNGSLDANLSAINALSALNSKWTAPPPKSKKKKR